ncbi:ATP-dependent zinc protease [Moritella marina ATCC 15381]|uniref:ATP-dependent zinc protease n=1 Tax=Moritella marina ATCC 15381 TaxID=1202962 RepID=A0A5J6WI10_MORMI|nr:ATP-dependent zinc protease [Moritella marina]QFI36858.1 ATP-dependent zinc protease [Moritella marina ATCC 15381]
MDTFKKPHQLIKAVILSALLSGCANVDQFLNQGEVSAQLTLQIEQQSEQIALLVEQQNTILATLSQQPAFFEQQNQNITELNSKLEDYLQLRQQIETNSKNIAIYETQNKLDESKQAIVLAQSSEATTPLNKKVIGSEELVLLDDLTEKYKARIDTGATTSSLNATDIVEFERDGKKWVRFNFNKNLNESQVIEAKIARTILIRQANSTEPTRRPIIELPVQLGEIKTLTEFTLADRRHMSFPVLLGRTFLKDIVMVDVARTYTSSDSITQ